MFALFPHFCFFVFKKFAVYRPVFFVFCGGR
jgi:hypothetical protein